MKQDYAIVYNALYKEIEMAIKNIKTLDFDTTLFEDELNSINNEVINNVKTNFVKNMAEASLINFYSSGVKKLNTLKNKLDYFNIYFKAYHTCQNISLKLNDKITKEELEKLVSEMIYILIEINKSSTIDYDSESKIVEKMYEVAYNVIKYEIIVYRTSTLYEFIKNTDINIQYFDALILKDIESIDLRKDENKELRIKISELMKGGIYSNYFDYELIKMILFKDKTLDFTRIITDEIKKISDEIILSNAVIKNEYEDAISINKEINRYKEKISENRKRLATKLPILSIILAGYIAGGFRIPKLSKKMSYGETYNKTTKTYSSMVDEIPIKNEEIIINDTPISIAIVYSEENRLGKREAVKYDVTDIDFDTFIKYYEKGLENYNIKIIETNRVKENGPEEGFIKFIEYEDLGYESLIEDEYIGGMVVLYFLYLVSEAIVLLKIFSYGSLIDKIKYPIKELSYQKGKKKIKTDELKQIIDRIIKEMNKNVELKYEFNKLFEDNKYLLNNPEELIKKINDLDMEKIKKLVKKPN